LIFVDQIAHIRIQGQTFDHVLRADAPLAHCSEEAQPYTCTARYSSLHIITAGLFNISVGQQQCFVQLSTMPVILCRGVGRTKAEARCAAARDALRCMNHVVIS